MSRNHIYFQQNLGNGIMKYMRVMYKDNDVEYDECIMQGEKVIDYNEKITDKSLLDEILNDPKTKGCPVVVFHGKTGIPLSQGL